MSYRFVISLLLCTPILGNIHVGSDGGFGGIVVTISEDVEQNDTLLEAIKEHFLEGSKALHTATGEQTFFSHVTILIPQHWNITADPTHLTLDDAQILVDSSSPSPGPSVRQKGRCGQPGDYMIIPTSYLLNNNVTKFGPIGKTLAHEWAHLRWGVYDEYPLSRDAKQYYIDTKNENTPPTCSKGINGEWVQPGSNQTTCDPRGSDDHGCIFKPTRAPDHSGSIMGYHFFENVDKFCDDPEEGSDFAHRHNSAAPTEQNSRCDGQSVMQVIRKYHPGDLTENVTLIDTTFTVTQERTERYIFVVEPIWSRADQNGKVANAIRNAVSSFVMKLPERKNTQIALWALTKNNHSIVIDFMTYEHQNNINSLLDSVDNITSSHWMEGCLNARCPGQLTSDYRNSITGVLLEAQRYPHSTVFLISYGGKPISVECTGNNDEIMTSVPATINYVLNFIQLTYPSNVFECTDIIKAYVDRSSGIYIKASPDGKKINFKPPQLPRSKGKSKQKSIAVLKEKFSSDSAQTNGTFIVEDGLQNNGLLTFAYNTTNSPSITVFGPDNTSYPINCTEDSCKYNIEREMAAGEWTYSIEDGEGIEFTFSFQAEATAGFIPITLEAYTSGNAVDFSGDDLSQKLLAVYADVSKGYQPVIEAEVTATLTQGESSSQIRLYDNGIGADTRERDGTYSAYFTKFESNIDVSISVNIDNSKGGAKVIATSGSRAIDSSYFEVPVFEPNEEEANPFLRYSEVGSVEVSNLPPNGTDLYPPARVVDLIVTEIDHVERQVRVQFTVTGDDLLDGTADRYEFKHAPATDHLRSKYDSANEVLNIHFANGLVPTPSVSGTIESIHIRFPDSSDSPQLTYAIALRVFDDDDQGSEVSNIASFSFTDKKYIVVKEEMETTMSDPIDTAVTNSVPIDNSGIGEPNENELIIGGVCGVILFLVVVVIVILVCCFGRRKCRKKQEDDESHIRIHMHAHSNPRFHEGQFQNGPQAAHQGQFPASPRYTCDDPPPYSQEPENTPSRTMRSTVRREMEEIEQLPNPPAPPPPPMRHLNRNSWDSIRGTIRDTRIGRSVAGAFNQLKQSRFYHGHISYRNNGNQPRRASIRVEIEPMPAAIPGNNQDYDSRPDIPSKKKNYNTKEVNRNDRLKASGKYAPSIDATPSNTYDHANWNKASGKYAPRIEPSQEVPVSPRPAPGTFPKPQKPPAHPPQKQAKLLAATDTIDRIPTHDNYMTNSGAYDDVIAPGVVNPGFMSETTERPTRQRFGSDSSEGIYSRVPNIDIPRNLSSTSEDVYTDAASSPVLQSEQDIVQQAFDAALAGQDHRGSGVYNQTVQPLSLGQHPRQAPAFGPAHSPRVPQPSPSQPVSRPALSPRMAQPPSSQPASRPALSPRMAQPPPSHPASRPALSPRMAQPPPSQLPTGYRISTSSFFDEIEEEQSICAEPMPLQNNEATMFKTKAKRLGFNYMEPK